MASPYAKVPITCLWLITQIKFIEVKDGRVIGLADKAQPVERFPAFIAR